MGLDDVKEWLHYCGRCNSCKFLYRDYNTSCPAFEKFVWECYTSSGKIWMARDLFEEKYPLSESIMEKVFSCTLCGNCTVQCQQEVSDHALDIFEALREECIEQGFIKPEHAKFRDNVEAVKNPYGEPHEARFTGIPDKYFKKTAEYYFFIGCTTSLRDKDLLMDILEILDLTGIDFTLSKDEICCGSPLLTTGQKKAAESLATENAGNIKKIECKKVLTACAGCFRTLKRQYPEKYGLLNDGTVEVLHLSEFLAEKLKILDLGKPNGQINVTYHDPCHLGRHVGVYEEPRKVLRKLPGVNFIEMPRNRDNSWCCGAGAGVKSAYKDWAIEISEERVLESSNLANENHDRITYLVTTCPFCERNLKDAHASLVDKQEIDANDSSVIDLFALVKKLIKKAA